MKTIALDEFTKYKFLSDIKYSPNQQCAAFIASNTNIESNGYDQFLYVYEDGNIRKLTSSGSETNYMWEDDEHILFLNQRDEKDIKKINDGEEISTFYRINIHGGEAQKAFSVPLQASLVDKLSQDVYLLSVQYDLNFSKAYLLKGEEKQELLRLKLEEKDYQVIDELPFYMNAQGFTNKIRSIYFLYDAQKDDLSRITYEKTNAFGAMINEDKDKILYIGDLIDPLSSMKTSLHLYDVKKDSNEEIIKANKYGIQNAYFDGDCIVFVASEFATYGISENASIYRYDMKTKKIEKILDQDLSIQNSVGSDCRYGSGKNVVMKDGTLYFITAVFNSSHLYTINRDGSLNKLIEKEGSIDCFDVGNNQILFVGMYENKLQELYSYLFDKKDIKQLTTLNEEVLNDKYVANYESIIYQNDGIDLYGWVLKPKDFDSTKKYPAILDIHGGPKTVYGEVFYHEMQYWANKGYFVFFTNPRGGDGRGNEFSDLRGKYGTIDYDDLMMFCDEVMSRYPSIDTSRVGVTGGSYGGFMTNWMITHTDRFACAASQRSIANWIGFNFTSDIGREFGKDQIAADVWSDLDKMWFHSPLKYAQSCHTPTLFIHSECDYRCPLPEAYQMYSALIGLGVETRLCVFHGENHELSRSGKPKHRIRRLKEITDWMDHYLK